MITCPKCQKEYPETDEQCPDCHPGKDTGKQKKSTGYYDYDSESITFSFKKIIYLVVGIFVVIFIAGVIAGIMSGGEEQDSNHETARIEVREAIDFPPEPKVNIRAKELFDYNQLKPWDGQSTRNTTDEDLIRNLFMTIGSANLKEDINLFQTGYSSDFPDWGEKRRKTLAMWQKYDFIKLGHYIAELDIQRDKAEAFLIWSITISERGGSPREMETTNQVTLRKEEDGWKIVELK